LRIAWSGVCRIRTTEAAPALSTQRPGLTPFHLAKENALSGSLNLHPKVAGGSLSACLALIILWAVSYWVMVPPEVAAAFTSALGFVGAWLSPAQASSPAS